MKDLRSVKETSKPHLRIKLQGHPDIWHRGKKLTTLRAVKARALLYFLVVEYQVKGQSVFPKEKLVDLLWPGMPLASALQNLRQTVYRIRKEIPLPTPDAHIIITDRKHVSLNTEVQLSSDLFWANPVVRQEAPDPETQKALTQPASPLLEHFSVPDTSHFDEWVDAMRERLHRIKIEGLNTLIRWYSDRPEAALPYAEHRALLQPYDEGSVSGYLQLLKRSGRSLQASSVFQDFSERLKTEFNEEPSAALSQWLDNSTPDFAEGQRGTRRHPVKNTLVWRYGIFTGVLLLLAFWLGGRFLPQKPTTGEWRIAVLPFDNQTDNAFLADGLTDEIIIALSKVEGVTTISRQSSSRYRDSDKTLQQIGEELGTPYLLKGKLSGQDGEWYVQVELISADDGRLIWSDGFRQKEEKVFFFRQGISREVIRNLTGSLDLTAGNLIQPPTENYQAYNAYLKGRNLYYQAEPKALAKAVEYFQRAIALDPDFTLAYSELAKTYCSMAGSWGDKRAEEMYPKVRAALDAIVGDPGLEGAYYYTLGWMSFWMLDLEQAEAYMRKSVAIDPNEEFVLSSLALYLCLKGQYEESEALARQGLISNPHFFWNYFVLAQTHYYAGEWKKAEEVLEKGLALFDGHAASIGLRANLYTLQGQPGKAVEYLSTQKKDSVKSWESIIVGPLGLAYLANDKREKAIGLARQLEARHHAGEKYCAIYAAKIYAVSGQTERALDLLEEALEQRDNELNWVGVDYAFRPLRGELRFRRILRELGLEGNNSKGGI